MENINEQREDIKRNFLTYAATSSAHEKFKEIFSNLKITP